MARKFEKNIEYSVNLKGKEPEFLMKIGFESLDDCLLSIAHRQLSNKGSGLKWDSKTSSWMRIINGIELPNAFEKNKGDTRIYHSHVEEHIKNLGLNRLQDGLVFVVISNGNLGNNPWHLAWQYDEEKKLYCHENEPFTKRSYTCFIVPRDKTKKAFIGKVRFNESEDLLDENGKNFPSEVKWCNYGQQIVKDSKVVEIEEIIEQFADVRHVFELKDWIKDRNNQEEKANFEKNLRIISELYEGHPEKFREKMLVKLREGFPRAGYYHSTLGVDENGIVLYHDKDRIEEIAKKLIDKEVKNSIILDQGGSVGVYASWLDGFLSKSSYFRDNRISNIAFVLK